jgi:hypothetical protein
MYGGVGCAIGIGCAIRSRPTIRSRRLATLAFFGAYLAGEVVL